MRKFRYSESAAGTGSDSPSRSMRDVSYSTKPPNRSTVALAIASPKSEPPKNRFRRDAPITTNSPIVRNPARFEKSRRDTIAYVDSPPNPAAATRNACSTGCGDSDAPSPARSCVK